MNLEKELMAAILSGNPAKQQETLEKARQYAQKIPLSKDDALLLAWYEDAVKERP